MGPLIIKQDFNLRIGVKWVIKMVKSENFKEPIRKTLIFRYFG